MDKIKVVLGWPKYSFRFSVTSYRKTQTNFLANLVYFIYQPKLISKTILGVKSNMQIGTCIMIPLT